MTATPLGCVTGRFQPVHAQHLELFEIALERCAHLLLAVTNPDTQARRAENASAHRHTAAANPFTYYERARLLEAAARERGFAERTTVVPFDLTRPEGWTQYVPLHACHFVRAYGAWEREKARRLEEAGYAVTLFDGNPAGRLCAGDIRASMEAGDPAWHALVPNATIPLLDEMLARVAFGART